MDAAMTAVTDDPSPNFGERRDGLGVELVVLHYTGMDSAEAALARLKDPSAEVSAHYLVWPGGEVRRLVPEEKRAWHAGAGAWGGRGDMNSRSVGIELANPGHELGYPPFPEPQMAALERLLAGIMERHGVPPEGVIGHACMAPGRKSDPGEKFDWRRLARRGLAVWLDPPVPGEGVADPEEFRAAAARFGYSVDEGEGWTAELEAVCRAFTQRFVPGAVADRATPAVLAHLQALAARWPALTLTA